MSLSKCGLNLNQSGKELQPHGTAAFPCAGYASTHTELPEEMIPWHWHEEMEIILITEGKMELRIPGKVLILNCNDIAILNGNILHSAGGAPACSLQSFVFSALLVTGSISSSFSEKYMQPMMKNPSFDCVIISNDKECIQSFRDAFDALEQNAFAYEFIVREKLSRILLKLYRKFDLDKGEAKTSHATDGLRLERMLFYIQNHYKDDITLEKISQAGQIGERECLRCFKRALGDSPIQYLLKYRLMQAAQMLTSASDTSIAEVSSSCGFDAPSYFSKQFKRFYQCSPKEYRVKMIDKAEDTFR